MNWLCRLGLHDWQVLDETTEVKVVYGPSCPFTGTRILADLVCLRCEKRDDQISRFRDKLEARRKRAQEIVDRT